MPARMTWLSSTSRPVAAAGPERLSEGPPRVPLCASAKTCTLLSSTESVISSPSEAMNSAAISASPAPGDGRSIRNPCTVRSPPLLKLTAASSEARYSVMEGSVREIGGLDGSPGRQWTAGGEVVRRLIPAIVRNQNEGHRGAGAAGG